MKELHGEGYANHTAPDSYNGLDETAVERRRETHAGRPLRRDRRASGTRTSSSSAEGNTDRRMVREPRSGLPRSETRSMRGKSLHRNPVISPVPHGDSGQGRSKKSIGRKSEAHARGKSDSPMVLKELPDRDGNRRSAETGQGKGSATRKKTKETDLERTQSRKATSIGLRGVREAAIKDKTVRFTALLHHVNVDSLRKSFLTLKRRVVPGADSFAWRMYERDLDRRLADLHARVHQGIYSPQPSRRMPVPYLDNRNRQPGISALEDQILQHTVMTVLNAIYENDFLGFSYGFRSGRSGQDGLDALQTGLVAEKVNWVLDAAIDRFFASIDHGHLMEFLECRIGDRRVLRLIDKWLQAGVPKRGRRSSSAVGTPRGALISPLLANVYLHYVLDCWAHQWRSCTARGDVIIVRYAGEFVLGFQHRMEAVHFQNDLRHRLAGYGLSLHPHKTRLIEFGRFADERRRFRGESEPETFDFLGVTHICARSRDGRRFTVRRKTVTNSLRA